MKFYHHLLPREGTLHLGFHDSVHSLYPACLRLTGDLPRNDFIKNVTLLTPAQGVALEMLSQFKLTGPDLPSKQEVNKRVGINLKLWSMY